MPGTYSKVKTVVTGEAITAADRNAEHDNHITYATPAGLDDYSSNAAAMQTTVDPYPASVESLATSLQGELERIRYVIAQITGETYWYYDPNVAIATFHNGTQLIMPLATAALPSYAFTGDLDTGGWSPAADTIAWSVGGTEGMRLSSTTITFQTSGSEAFKISGSQSLFQDGAVGTPSIGFSDDTNTGLYRIGADNFGFATNGAISGQITTQGIGLIDGAAATPSLFFNSDTNSGIYWASADTWHLVAGGSSKLGVTSGGLTGVAFGDGTEGAPSISFSSDTDSGFYRIGADDIVWVIGGSTSTGAVRLNSGKLYSYVDIDPISGSSLNMGNATYYWGDISYKTLTDRGCLGWFDDGVELQDGSVVSDIQALRALKKHPEKKTIYGAEMIDYKSFPRVCYKPADKKGTLLPRDENDEPYDIDEKGNKIQASDGIEMTSMFSIMIGAIKENDKEIMRLKEEIKRLKGEKQK